MNAPTIAKKSAMFAAIAAAVLVGAAGGSMLNAVKSNAQTPAPVTTTAPSTGGTQLDNTAPNETFKSNENPAHEAKESATREAQENSGQRPTVQ